MALRAGVLSLNNEIIESARDHSGCEISRYRNFESLKSDDFNVLIIDAEYFEGEESVQFFLSRIRKKLLGIPVLLTVNIDAKDIINFEWFFDDFIFYPFRKGELKLRLAHLIKGHEANDESTRLFLGHLCIDLNEYSVFLNDTKLDFTYKEFELMRLFAQNRGKVFSRKELLSRIWGVEYIGGTRTVDVHIRRLRSKLGDEFNSVIETVRNVGYRCRD